MLKRIHTAALEIAYKETDVAEGMPVVLLHAFPYDVRAYDGVAGRLAQRCRVLLPYLRGYGATRFLSRETLRSGQQAALDLRGHHTVPGVGHNIPQEAPDEFAAAVTALP